MPFGVKPDASGRIIDFDLVYKRIFKPAIEHSGLLPVRADEEQAHGFIHKVMYERLLLPEYAIADLTILNANVYHELGVRHAARPATTIMVMADQTGLPFEVTGLRALTYSLDADEKPSNTKNAVSALQQRLTACIAHDLVDSPLYQLVDALQPPPIDRERCDIFRERAAHSVETKTRLANARAEGKVEAIRVVEERLGDTSVLEAGVVIDLLLSYRAVEAYANRSPGLANGPHARVDRSRARTARLRTKLSRRR